MKRILLLLLSGLVSFCIDAGAQNTDTGRGSLNGSTVRGYSGGMGNTVMGTRNEMISHEPDYGTKSDKRMEELDREMEERKWANEKEAWDRACELDSKEAYKKYVALFPTGIHRGDADKKIIDFEVEEILNGEYEALPAMKQVGESDDSPTSTISILNTTEYPLTVWYSGTESKSITIAPRGKGAIVISNGFYRIAASVPDAHIRPFAGEEYVLGGKYETGYCIVYGR